MVTVLYNSADVIDGCLESLPEDAEVIVVDNASVDDGAVAARRVRPDAIVVRSSLNRGFGGGCNLGWERATRPYVAFVNPDVRLHPGALEVMLDRLTTEAHGMVGPALLEEDGSVRRCNRRSSALVDAVHLLPAATRWAPSIGLDAKLAPIDPVHNKGGSVSFVEGACFLIRRADLAAVGGFDEDLFLYCEEESLAVRLATLGGRAVYEPAATAEHAGAASTKEIGGLATRHFFRSRVLLYRKRDGNLRGMLAAATLAVAGLVALPTAIVNSLLHRRRINRPAYVWNVLRGVAAGAAARRRSDITYP